MQGGFWSHFALKKRCLIAGCRNCESLTCGKQERFSRSLNCVRELDLMHRHILAVERHNELLEGLWKSA